MGCVASKLDINDVHPNMFAVNNVDDMGTKLNSGHLEITDSELVLHQKGKQPIKWPLKYLKRYGFEEGLFSFEAGRKNPTGPGIYAFKCRRAENLFNLLQVRVRNQTPGGGVVLGTAGVVDGVAAQPVDGGGALPGGMVQVGGGEGSPGGDSPVEERGPQTQDTAQPTAYMNCSLPSTTDPTQPTGPPRVPPLHPGDGCGGYNNITQERPNTAGDSPPNQPPPLSPAGDPSDPRHDYENVGPDTVVLHSPGYLPPRNVFVLPPKPSFLKQISSNPSEHNESNEGPNLSPLPLYGSPPASPSPSLQTGGEVASINYILLDLDTTKIATPALPTSTTSTPQETGDHGGKGRGYVTIDFDKTDALIKSANQRFFETDDPGVRKTRHNSCLSDLGAGKLGHNSSN